jgi:anti-anti-sigma factor
MGDELAAAAPAVFTVRYRLDGHGTAVVTLAGELDIFTCEPLAACADELSRLRCRGVRFDLAALTFTDTSGAHILAAACRCLRMAGCPVTVTGLRPPVGRVLELLGLPLGGDGDAFTGLRPTAG